MRFQPAKLNTVHALDKAELSLDSCSHERVFVCLAIRRVAVDREGCTVNKESTSTGDRSNNFRRKIFCVMKYIEKPRNSHKVNELR